MNFKKLHSFDVITLRHYVVVSLKYLYDGFLKTLENI